VERSEDLKREKGDDVLGEEGVLEGDWKIEAKLFLSFDSGGGV
jgi:hypothetical protein